ncbi:hypothetical protein [Bradyrhizobium sp. HKCCYLS20291]|uniref:hypothetical protein n=1 Tax=Bradyrhizobium sp. HKCCYLS20291 TaxID=3420766 RepID=UPI003EBCDF73
MLVPFRLAPTFSNGTFLMKAGKRGATKGQLLVWTVRRSVAQMGCCKDATTEIKELELFYVPP